MRMLHFLRLLAEYLASLTDAQQRSAGDDALEEALRKLTGLSFTTVDSLPPAQLAELIAGSGDGDARLFAAAEILRLRAELYRRFHFDDEALSMEKKALGLYLCLDSMPPDLSKNLYTALKTLYLAINGELSDQQLTHLACLYESAGYYADAEDMLCMQQNHPLTMDFYTRLQDLPDDELERGSLPRHEVAEGVERIERITGGTEERG